MASDEAKAGAIGLVNDFRTRGLSMWGAIRREQLADGLIVRINDPTQISSKASQLCGAASVVYNLAQADPSAYARLAIDLYEKGEGKVKSLTIMPSADLRKTAVRAGTMPQTGSCWRACAIRRIGSSPTTATGDGTFPSSVRPTTPRRSRCPTRSRPGSKALATRT